ncbi:MAG: PAS domain S-box protein, partial [bacterium]|nr:PAS domain S-box protein [bacterium]
MRFLIIDDEISIRTLVSKLLRVEFPGCRIMQIGDRASFEEHLDNSKFDVVITDYYLGWIDGLEVLKAVKQRDPYCPVIMFTGSGDEEIAVEAMKSGLDDYVLKSPERFKRLAPSIKMALEHKRTEQKKRHIEQELIESEERLEAILQSVTDHMSMIDRSLNIIWTNNTALKSFGGDLLGKNCYKAYYGRETVCDNCPAMKTFDDGNVHHHEISVQTEGEGERIFFCTTKVALRDDQGEPMAVLELSRDVTERKRAKEELERAYNIINDSQTMAFLWKNAENFPVEYVTENVKDVLGYTAEEFMSGAVSWPGITHPDDEPRLRAELERNLELGINQFSQDYRLIAKSGDIKWISDRTSAIMDENGTITHYQAVVIDVTDQKRVEDLKFLNAMALELAETHSTDELRKLIGEKLKEFTGAVMVLVNGYDAEKNELKVEHIAAKRGTIGSAQKVLGSRLKEMRFIIPPEVYARMITERVAKLTGIYELSFEAIPKKAAGLMEKTLGLGSVYGLALYDDKSLFGTAAVLLPWDNELLFIESLKVFAHMAAASLGRVQVEEVLRESEAKFRMVSDYSFNWEIFRDRNGRLIYINPAFERITGYTVEEYMSGKVTREDLLHPEDLEKNQKLFAEAMGGTVIKEFECRLIQKDGRLIFISVSSQPVITESGEHVGNRLSIRDITERKTAEEALRHSEEKFKKVVSTSPDAIMVFDAKTKKIVEVNKACEDLYGYVRKEFLDLCQPDISAEPEKSATSIIRALKGKLHHIPLRYHRKNNGTVFPVEISMATFDYFGYTMICEVVRDISERKRLEREIIEISGREQRRIGQDLHDGLGQQLTGVSY